MLSLVLLVLVNWYAARRYARFDWTSAGSFTLSSRSVEIVRGLREPVDLYVLLARDEPLYADVSELAERYAAASARVRLHYIDPDRQRERLLGLSQDVGLQLLQANNGERTLSTAAILVRRGSRHWEVQRESLRELGQPDGDDEQGATRVLNAKITVERSISESLLNVSQDRATKLCFTTGHAEMTLTRSARSGASLAEALRHLNFVVEEVEVHGSTGVPASCDAVIVAGAQRTWSSEDEAALIRYLRAGGNVAVFVDLVVLEGRIVPTGLENLARLAGMQLPAALTVESDARHLLSETVPVHFRADTWNDHEITRDLRGSSIIAGMVRPVRRAEGSDVAPELLVSTTPSAWGETGIAELLRTFTPVKGGEDVAGPIAIAMASQLREVTRRAEGAAAGRVVFAGTSEVLGDEYFSLSARASVANANLAESIVGWLTARRELVNIPSRPASRAALLVSERDLGQIGLYVILLIPLAAALVGYAVYRSRRTS
jgi:hypothetical protein